MLSTARYTLKARLPAGFRNFRSSAALDAKVLCSDPIDAVCPEILKAKGHTVDVPPGDKPIPAAELKKIIGQYDALIVRSGTKVTPEILDAATKLKFIGRAGSGVDNVDLPAATRRGIVVMNTPGGNTAAAAELTMALILGLSRNIPQACLAMKAGKWDRKKFKGSELSGKTIGIVGLGNIGRQVAKYCQQFGMRTIGYDPILTPAAAEKLNIEMTPLATLYGQSDFITLHLPLIEQTRHLLNAAAFSKCKTGARIINCARGGVVNEKDLLDALNSGQIGGAAIDAFENEPLKEVSLELASHSNVICTPHIGASTKESQFRVARDIANYLNDALEKRKYFGVVNADSLDMHLRSDLQPWVDLADRVGQLQASLLGKSALDKVVITFQGAKLADSTVANTLKSAILRGLFQVVNPSIAPNLVNTPILVKEFGLNVAEQVSQEAPKDFDNLITVEFTGKGAAPQRVAATLVGNVPKIVAINDYPVDVCPDGDMLVFTNSDRPGVLKRITSLLARSEINIASLSLSRNSDGKALGILNLDNQLPGDVFEKLQDLDDVHEVMSATVSPYFVKAEKAEKDVGEPHLAVSVSSVKKPREKPNSANFGSGPTAKPHGWTLSQLADGALGRSHRSSLGLKKLREAIAHTKSMLNVPSDYHVGIVPASDTGAFEMAMWSMLGPRTVDVAFWESFGKGWFGDAKKELKLNVNAHKAEYGLLPKMPTDPENDVLFTWNGTTSGVRVPNADWIGSKDRGGLVFCDATSAVFAQDVPINKLDVVTYSWQKVLGGEGAHGMLILSPKAVQRLESYTPSWPMPKIFRMVKDGKLEASIFDGSTINTPSMLCVEDYLQALNWAEKQGGLKGLIDKCNSNLAVVEEFVAQHDWIDFLAKDPATRSNTSVCLSLKLSKEQIKKMTTLLEKEGVAYDIGSYRDAPPGLRIWCGATVEKSDLEALMPWIQWAYNTVVA